MQTASTSVSFDRSLPSTFYLWAGGLVLLAALGFLLLQGQFHLLAAVAIGLSLVCLSVVDKRLAVLLTFAFLFLMGDIRRLISVAEPQPRFDPIQLIGPMMAVFLAVPYLLRLVLRDTLSKLMLALLIIMTLEIANPLQGGLSVGITGAFFYIVPVLWFWIGRGLGSTDVVKRLIYHVVFPLSVLAALLGLYQTFVGFLPYEQAWINSATRVLTALYVGSTIRAFGFSVTPAEYATLLQFGILASIAAFFSRQRALILLLPLLVAALLLESSRGIVVYCVFAISIIWVMRRGQRLRPWTLLWLGALGILSLVALSLIAARLAPPDEAPRTHTNAVQNDLTHQLGGLAHPLDPRYSTAGTHAGMVAGALSLALHNPVGFGLGYSTFAAEKLGNSAQGGSSEMDLSDMFEALGIVGGLVYLSVAVLVVKYAFQQLRFVPGAVGLCLLALLTGNFGHWLVGGQYATSSLLFFLFGSLSYQKNDMLDRVAISDVNRGL